MVFFKIIRIQAKIFSAKRQRRNNTINSNEKNEQIQSVKSFFAVVVPVVVAAVDVTVVVANGRFDG